MLDKNYYFLGTLLPALYIEIPPEISFFEAMHFFSMNLAPGDLGKVRALRTFLDVKNVYYLWTQESLDPRGNLSRKELEEALINKVNLPEYLFEFLDKHESEQNRIKYFSEVIAHYFREEQQRHKGFLKKYLSFERQLRLVLAAFRAKRHSRDLTKEFQFEDPNDFFVQELLAAKDHPDFIFPFEFSDLEDLLMTEYRDPLKEYQILAKYRFNKIEEMTIEEDFTIDWLLSYTAKLMAVEDWWKLDEEEGSRIFNEIVKEIA